MRNRSRNRSTLSFESMEHRILLDGDQVVRWSFDPNELGIDIEPPQSAISLDLMPADDGNMLTIGRENNRRIESACVNGCQITIGSGTYPVQSGVSLGSDSHIWMDDNTILEIVHNTVATGVEASCNRNFKEISSQPGTGLGLFDIVTCRNLDHSDSIENVSIVGGLIVGTRSELQSAQTGEHAIHIKGDVRNVLIHGVTMRDLGGDGIAISFEDAIINQEFFGRPAPSRIALRAISSTNNVRHGISVVAGTDIAMEDIEVSNNGVIGLDVENEHNVAIRSLDLFNIRAEGNTNSGISIGRGVFTDHLANGEVRRGGWVTDVNLFEIASSENQGPGLRLSGVVNASIQQSTFRGNNHASPDACTGPGIALFEVTDWELLDSSIIDNSDDGLCAVDVSNYRIENNAFLRNEVGIRMGGNPQPVPSIVCGTQSQCVIRDNSFEHNLQGMVISSGIVTVESNDILASQTSLIIQSSNPVVLLDSNRFFQLPGTNKLNGDIGTQHGNQELVLVVGDVNFDGRMDSTDLVLVFQSGQYEDGESKNSSWAQGDWNGDGEFDSSDLILAFQTNSFGRPQ